MSNNDAMNQTSSAVALWTASNTGIHLIEDEEELND